MRNEARRPWVSWALVMVMSRVTSGGVGGMNHTFFTSRAVAVASPAPDTIHATVTSHREADKSHVMAGCCAGSLPAWLAQVSLPLHATGAARGD